jgi:oligopeptide/dipeptide ABC transporter ATP-binding protein
VTASLLELDQVSKTFSRGGLFRSRRVEAVKAVSFRIDANRPEIFTIIGESGSGKSTTARMILGIERPTSGRLVFDGSDIGTIRTKAERMRFMHAVQPIFQNPFEAFNPLKRLDRYLFMTARRFGAAADGAALERQVDAGLRKVGLSLAEIRGRFPHELSGGQLQRVAIARALLSSPKLVVADEPVSMVDASLRATILGSLRELNRAYGISLIYITHDLTTAYQISENIVVLYRGSVAEVGDVEKVVGNPMHPYTRLLVGSVPLPDPDKQWLPEPPPSEESRLAGSAPHNGCAFAARCPNAMAICRQERPPLYQIDEHRAAACYLYLGKPEIAADELNKVMVLPAAPVA